MGSIFNPEKNFLILTHCYLNTSSKFISNEGKRLAIELKLNCFLLTSTVRNFLGIKRLKVAYH